MGSKTKELVKAGHELVVLLGNQHGMLDAASLVQRLTAQLDITAIVLREKSKQCDRLAAENAALKSGAAYFSYGSEHYFECHKTQQAAIEAAEAAIDDYRGDACDGWSEEVDSVCWGVIMQRSTKVGERPRTEEDSCDPSIDTVCDYALLPNIATPATDAWQREQMAQAHKEGAYFVANRMLAAWEAGFIEDTAKNAADIARMILTSTEFMVDAPEGDFDRSFADGVLEDIAAQLRNGEAV